MAEQTDSTSPAAKPTSPLLVAVAWAVVVIPAAWGITQTVKVSTKLFSTPATQPTTHPAAR